MGETPMRLRSVTDFRLKLSNRFGIILAIPFVHVIPVRNSSSESCPLSESVIGAICLGQQRDRVYYPELQAPLLCAVDQL